MTLPYEPFDRRGYPTVSVADGYAEWAATYDATVQDEMDIRLLDRVKSVRWADCANSADLACGTGRIGRWLKARGAARIEGVDLSEAMLAQAQVKSVYAALHCADVSRTGLPTGKFALLTMVLAECHLEALDPFYREAARLLGAQGALVIVGYHPHFLMKGVPSHFDRADGSSVAIQNYIHLFSDHARAALANGFALAEMEEGLIDDDWIARHARYAKHRDQPVSFCMVWRKAAPPETAAGQE